jgi:hypothetical protein
VGIKENDEVTCFAKGLPDVAERMGVEDWVEEDDWL